MLLDELKNEDIQTRLQAVRNMSTVAKATGPEHTRKDLLPLLRGSFMILLAFNSSLTVVV